MDKYAGLAFRDEVVIDTGRSCRPLLTPTASSGTALNRFSFSRPFYRPIGLEATTLRMNETVETSVFERWRADTTYRPANLLEWEGLRLGAL
jgi:hypothetical protein